MPIDKQDVDFALTDLRNTQSNPIVRRFEAVAQEVINGRDKERFKERYPDMEDDVKKILDKLPENIKKSVETVANYIEEQKLVDRSAARGAER